MDLKVSCLWKTPDATKGYRTGVSLHGHTNFSRESLGFVADYIQSKPLLRRIMARERERCAKIDNGKIDLERAYWTPPLSPQAALRLEKQQIEREMGLQSLVSISDHDSIAAPTLLRVTSEGRDVPVSVEWTAPCNETVFHFGVHNLPAAEAEEAMQKLSAYTARPQRERLTELLLWLDSMPDVLVILNHPLWDLYKIGARPHQKALDDLLRTERTRIHALELSGIRDWSENQGVRRLAGQYDMMLVSGGDRHGTEPNATLNLTNADTFEEFVHEIRRERVGHILFMPQYTEPKVLRVLDTVLSAIREYPENPENARRWDQRTFHPDRDGTIQPLVKQWVQPPPYIRAVFAVLSMLDRAPVRRSLHLALRKPQASEAASLSGREEIAR